MALTHDEALIDLLAETCQGYEFIIVDSESDLGGELVRRQPGVVLIDAEGATQAIDVLARRLHGQFPELGLIVTGSSEDQAALSAEITQGVIHRFLHKPVSAERVKLFVDSAWKRHAEERERSASRAASAAAAPATPVKLPPRNVIAGAAAALAAVVAIGLWFASRSPDAPRPAAARTLSAAEETAVRKTLERADEALARGNLTTADGAAALYASVLKQDAGNARARDGIGHVVDRLLTGAERALVSRREDDAMRLIESARSIQPDHPRVAFLLAQVGKQRERDSLTDKRNIQANVAEMLDLASRRLRSGALDAPERDNARFYIEAARVLAPNDPGVKAAQRELDARLAERAVRSAPAAKPAERSAERPAERLAERGAERGVERAVAPAPSAPPPQTVASAPSPAIAATPPPPAIAATAPAPIQAAPSTAAAAPAGDTAPAATPARSAAPDIVIAGSLTRTRYVEPVYPRQARTRNTAGWVEAQFTVRTDGSVGDVAVTGSEPAGLFDAAAVTALRQWHYKPVTRDGRPVEQRARIRIRFAVE